MSMCMSVPKNQANFDFCLFKIKYFLYQMQYSYTWIPISFFYDQGRFVTILGEFTSTLSREIAHIKTIPSPICFFLKLKSKMKGWLYFHPLFP